MRFLPALVFLTDGVVKVKFVIGEGEDLRLDVGQGRGRRRRETGQVIVDGLVQRLRFRHGISASVFLFSFFVQGAGFPVLFEDEPLHISRDADAFFRGLVDQELGGVLGQGEADGALSFCVADGSGHDFIEPS